ncbi:hypothetical protein Phum_PHUM448410 [Pediculus humanus corporis]|uniref:Uncharacterized protein n=1 Tax=Pediculus humanus subsp. corporis TaxID=121224 RepID=E0VU97_PEDHC|nr:uncharacterized protein Phum_PHUM448410 [Pediculus humanus corporis]EEB16953.1 hypothetical protein Phum_PHUM448410 [Pediculus humanus corporis]
MHKFIKLFSRPNAPGSENKCKPHNESIGKRKIGDKHKKIEKTKSNSSENFLALSTQKRNVNSLDNLDGVKDGGKSKKDISKEKESAISLDSGRVLKAPSSSNILHMKKDSDDMLKTRHFLGD